MKYEILQASNVAKRAIRKENKKKSNQEQLIRQKKYAMKQYRKMLNNKKKVTNSKFDLDDSKYIEWAIIAIIGLAVLSVNFPQVGILAVIFSILIIATIMDTKFKAIALKHKNQLDKKEAHLEKVLKIIKNEKLLDTIEVKSKRRLSVLEKTINKIKISTQVSSSDDKSFTEFPYQTIQ